MRPALNGSGGAAAVPRPGHSGITLALTPHAEAVLEARMIGSDFESRTVCSDSCPLAATYATMVTSRMSGSPTAFGPVQMHIRPVATYTATSQPTLEMHLGAASGAWCTLRPASFAEGSWICSVHRH